MQIEIEIFKKSLTVELIQMGHLGKTICGIFSGNILYCCAIFYSFSWQMILEWSISNVICAH